MGAVTPVKVYGGELSGEKRLFVVTFTPASASDTLTFTAASHGFDTIHAIVSCELSAGEDANLLTIHPSFSGLVVTVVTKDAAGSAASDWTGAAATLTLLVSGSN